MVIRDNQPIVPRGRQSIAGRRPGGADHPAGKPWPGAQGHSRVKGNRGTAAVREKEYLRQRYAAILSYVGMILLLSGGVMLTPLLVLFAYPEEAAHASAFGLPAGCLALLGIGLWRLFRPASNITLSIQEGGIIVLISWIAVSLFSAWPFISVLGLSFSRALFESVSGWTTTGLSVVDVKSAGPLILFWRSVMQLAGGAGLAIIMMSAIVGPTGVGISSAEGRSDQLVPHVRQSARLVLIIYACYAGCRNLGLLDGGHVALRCGQPCLCSGIHGRFFHARGQHRVLGFRSHRGGDPAVDAAGQLELRHRLVPLARQAQARCCEMERSACWRCSSPCRRPPCSF